VVVLTLEIICPIVVVCWHTGLVSAYRRAPLRAGPGSARSGARIGLGAVTSGTIIRAVRVSAYRTGRAIENREERP